MRHDIGECSIDTDVGYFEFYPTLKNIRSICEPEELPELFANVNGVLEQKRAMALSFGFKELANCYMRKIYQLCAVVMQSCCRDDITPIIGRIKWEKSAKHFQLGKMPLDHMVAFSKILLKHGVVGLPAESEEDSKPASSIDVYRYVDAAISHLGMSKEQAEGLTKTEFDRLIESKFPDSKRNGTGPTDQEHKDAMDFLDRVNAARGKK